MCPPSTHRVLCCRPSCTLNFLAALALHPPLHKRRDSSAPLQTWHATCIPVYIVAVMTCALPQFSCRPCLAPTSSQATGLISPVPRLARLLASRNTSLPSADGRPGRTGSTAPGTGPGQATRTQAGGSGSQGTTPALPPPAPPLPPPPLVRCLPREKMVVLVSPSYFLQVGWGLHSHVTCCKKFVTPFFYAPYCTVKPLLRQSTRTVDTLQRQAAAAQTVNTHC